MARPVLSRAIRNARAMLRAQEWGDSSIPPNSQAGSFGGAAQSGAYAVSTVLACIQVLHDDVTTMPFAAFSGVRNGPRQLLPNQPRIVSDPFGPDLDPAAGMGQLIVSKLMRGNAFAFVAERNGIGFPSLLVPIHPDTCTPFKREGRKLYRVKGEVFGPDEIVHVTGMMDPGAVAGVDVLTAQRLTWQAAIDVATYGQRFFGGGGSPSVVISAPGSGDQKKVQLIKDGWMAAHGGPGMSHEPAVVFGGATVVPISVTPENAQFLDTRRFLREEICGLFKVPLQRVQAIVENASQGGGKGLDSIDAGYVKHSLLPLVAPFERAWGRMVPGGTGTWVGFDFREFLRADAKERADVAQVHRVTGIRSPNEIRADEGWAPYEGGDAYDTPLNSNSTSPTGGVDNQPDPGTTPGGDQ